MPEQTIPVRKLPAQQDRVETGVTMFGEDWPGLFIRGDDCFHYAQLLRRLLAGNDDSLTKAILNGLVNTLESSNARINNAFGWKKDEGSTDESA